MRVLGVAAVAWTLAAGGACPQPVPQSSVTTTALYQACQRSHEPLEEDQCSGYILATFDALSRTRRICPPVNIEGGSLQAVIIGRRYLAAHPEKWSAGPSFVLEDAFREAFPCKTG